LPAFSGNIANSWTRVGKRLIKAPFVISLLLKNGKTNTSPKMPPHTILGYNQESFGAGAMATPKYFD